MKIKKDLLEKKLNESNIKMEEIKKKIVKNDQLMLEILNNSKELKGFKDLLEYYKKSMLPSNNEELKEFIVNNKNLIQTF